MMKPMKPMKQMKPGNDLKPLGDKPVEAYLSNSLQIADVMEKVLGYTGPAHVVISTFSVSEEFIRRILRLKKEGRILTCSMFCDIRGARKTLAIYDFLRGAVDSVYLCENHSKVLLFRGERDAAVVTSQNQTRGNRYECGVVMTMPEIVSQLSESLEAMKAVSRPLSDVISCV